MPAFPWTSALFGVALGGANAAAAYALYRAGIGRSQKAFLRIAFGGMAVRLVVVTALVALVLFLLPADHRVPFAGGFFAALVAGTAAEVLLLQRHARHARQPQP